MATTSASGISSWKKWTLADKRTQLNTRASLVRGGGGSGAGAKACGAAFSFLEGRNVRLFSS